MKLVTNMSRFCILRLFCGTLHNKMASRSTDWVAPSMVSPRPRAGGFASSAAFTTGIIEGTLRCLWPNARDEKKKNNGSRHIDVYSFSNGHLANVHFFCTRIAWTMLSPAKFGVACESSVNFLELVAPRTIHTKMKIGRSHASVQFSRGYCNRILKLPPYFLTWLQFSSNKTR